MRKKRECIIIDALWARIEHYYQVRRPRQRVRLPAPRLSVAEDGGGEPVHGHVHQALDARVLHDVLLGGLRLEHNVEGEGLQLGVLAGLLVNLKVGTVI